MKIQMTMRRRVPLFRTSLERPAYCLALISILAVLACGRDGGSRPTATPADPIGTGSVLIERLVPGRTVVADSIIVRGSGFGSSGEVTFAAASGGRVAGRVESWSDTLLVIEVPSGVADGPVQVRAGGVASNERDFSVAPRPISYIHDVLPQIFENGQFGCASCHGGQNNLYLESVEAILRGDSDHGPVVIPRDGAGSIIVQKISPTPPFDARMPLGCSGNCVGDEQRQLLMDWIDQGARNN
jgi:hypothetical protein